MDLALAEKRFDVSSEEALNTIFSDAVALFFRDDCMIAASRAPAWLLIPGTCMTDYVQELPSDHSESQRNGHGAFYSVEDCCLNPSYISAMPPDEDDEYEETGPLFADRIYILPFPGMEELNIGILPLRCDDVSAPLSRLIPSLDELTRISVRASVIRESATGAELYSRIAEVVCAIAGFTGVGAVSSGFSGDYVFTDSFNAPAFIALTLGTEMLYRRTALRRSFNWIIDALPGRNALGDGKKTGNIPLLRFDAVLSEEVPDDDMPEIGALGRIAEMWDALFECYLTPTENGGKRLCVCFSPVCRDVGELGLKAETKCSDDCQDPAPCR